MNIGGIGNTGVDYTKLTSRQLEQQEVQQESEAAQVQAAQTVQQKPQTSGSDSGNGSGTGGNPAAAAQTQTSATAAVSRQLAQTLTTGSDSEESNTALINKANSGAELSQAELSQLKDLDFALYAQAVKAQKAREEVRAQMKQNPSHAASFADRAASQAVGQEDSAVALRAIADEYNQFAAKYDQMDFGSHLFR
ncbi:hypothetical protein LJC63_10295 [Ruminococcaceae bacterium OttesenSCG-928-L11]|nr:hypothetical protein [Ruminococcaceae bacterium OttesenSCG-928-L11]